MDYPISFKNLINSLRKLPGVGNKSAEKMAFDILNMDEETRQEFASTISNASLIKTCPHCGVLTDDDMCEICSTPSRDHSQICIVHNTKDVFVVEKMNEYQGTYHVLNGYIKADEKITSSTLNLDKLCHRIETEDIKEVILATDLTMEGEITAMYISKVLAKYASLKVTRLAHGLPMGAMLDYADELTLYRAFSNRKEIK